MEVGSLSDGVGSYSSGELHEHGDWKQMEEIKKKAPWPSVGKKNVRNKKGKIA
jgi:hypothetical protein